MSENIHFSLPVKHVSDTAWLVAAFRAVESERPDAHFKDPLAGYLIGEKGKHLVNTLPNIQFGQFMLVVRTCVIDEMIQKAISHGGCKTVINLACGLDTRPYRMDLPSTFRWVEVDLPGVIDYKTEALYSQTPRCQLERHVVDLRIRDERQKFLKKICKTSSETLVLTEGLLYYLSNDNVAALSEDLIAQANVQWWVMDLFDPKLFETLKNQESASGGQKEQTYFFFAPAEPGLFFSRFGWKLSQFRSFSAESHRLNRLPPADFLKTPEDAEALKKSGILLLESLI